MTKLIDNTVTAINAAALAEALAMVGRAGLDAEAFLEVAGSGSGASTMLELKAKPMLERDFEPLFKLEHMLKDVRHCLAEAGRWAWSCASPRRPSALRQAAAGGHGGGRFRRRRHRGRLNAARRSRARIS